MSFIKFKLQTLKIYRDLNCTLCGKSIQKGEDLLTIQGMAELADKIYCVKCAKENIRETQKDLKLIIDLLEKRRSMKKKSKYEMME